MGAETKRSPSRYGEERIRQLMRGGTVLILALAGCTRTDEEPNGRQAPPVADEVVSACDNSDGALTNVSFVLVTEPRVGERVSPGFTVRGCSSTFEANVQWRLLSRAGVELESGFTSGGSMTAGPFAFTVSYTVIERQMGRLAVYEEDVSDGEGFPPGRVVLPLVLQP